MPALSLPEFTALRFSGPDAAAFLHGQLTCDVLGLKPGICTYGGYCTPKGRLLATFLLWNDDTGYWMVLPAAVAEGVHKRLSMYILRARVKAESLSAECVCAGVLGPDLAPAIAALGGHVPERVYGSSKHAGCTVLRVPGDRCLVLAPIATVSAPADDGRWNASDITNGIPFIQPATQEEFVPQMVNLDLIGALSYTKGCYPGQEIVARTHYLGRLKQRMYRATTTAAAGAGDKLYCAELGDQAAGMIVSAAPAFPDRADVLAVMQTAYATTSTFHCGTTGGPALSLADLPYPLQ